MGHYKVKDQTGTREYQEDVQSVNAIGSSSAAVADAGVVVTSIDATAGVLIVKDETTTDTATFLIVDTGGTVAPQLLGTQANFTIAEDNAGTINVYVDTGVINIQNNSGGIVDISYKAFV